MEIGEEVKNWFLCGVACCFCALCTCVFNVVLALPALIPLLGQIFMFGWFPFAFVGGLMTLICCIFGCVFFYIAHGIARGEIDKDFFKIGPIV